MKSKLTLGAVVTILSVLLFDQSLKIWVKTTMCRGDSFSVIGDWFIIHFVENPGMAFGMTFAGAYGKLILTTFRLVAVSAILYYLIGLIRKNQPLGLIVSISLIFAGALGNIVDSVFYGVIFSGGGYHGTTPIPAELFPDGPGYSTWLHGSVVDMLYFPLISGELPEWFPVWGGEPFVFFRPVFNIADSAISVGVALIIIFQKRFFSK